MSAFGALAPFGALGLSELKPLAAAPTETHRPAHVAHPSTFGDIDDDIDAVDAVDPELFPIFEEEALELLPKLAAQLRDWAAPADRRRRTPAACMRTLHTLKGGARLAGAMRLGEMAHRLETRIERLTGRRGRGRAPPTSRSLQGRSDAMAHAFDALRSRDAQAYADAVAAAIAPRRRPASGRAAPADRRAPPCRSRRRSAGRGARAACGAGRAGRAAAQEAGKGRGKSAAASAGRRARRGRAVEAAAPAARRRPPTRCRRRAARDRLVAFRRQRRRRAGQAGRARPGRRSRRCACARRCSTAWSTRPARSASRARASSPASARSRGRSRDLTENLERLRGQLRDIELQGEMQMTSRLEAAKAASQAFDPLEFDRFTRFQELTRMMAESVNDVATVQRTLQRSLEQAEDELVAQARLTRDLQDDLLRTRMVEFEGLSDRLYRVVRQAAKETGKQVRLDIVGGSIEVDRGVLDRMTGAFEHLLRNCVAHGIEPPEARSAAGKDPTGTIVVALSHEGNEVGVEFRDDGAGLDLARIRAKAEAMGLIDPKAPHDDAELANLIFTAGFTTADKVTELAGRGVGMDVVRSEVIAMGGRIETATAAGPGHVVQADPAADDRGDAGRDAALRRQRRRRAVDAGRDRAPRDAGARSMPPMPAAPTISATQPAVLLARRAAADRARAGRRGRAHAHRRRHPQRPAAHRGARRRSARQPGSGGQEPRAAALAPARPRRHDAARLGRGGADLQPGRARHALRRRARARRQGAAQTAARGRRRPTAPAAHAPPAAPLVLVVDDSLTVRRVTQRLLVREGYRVTLAKDGLDALERLAEEVPQVVLSDIEMPRMDGFDLVRNLRADAALARPAGDHDHLAHRPEAPRPRDRARRRPLPRQALLGRGPARPDRALHRRRGRGLSRASAAGLAFGAPTTA